MSTNPSATLQILFSMDSKIIDRDIESAKDRLKEVAEETSSLLSLPRDAFTPEIEARTAHLMMIQAHELCRQSRSFPEAEIFYVSFGAGNVVNDVESISYNKGALADLLAKMDAIRRREGLADDEYWMSVNDAPLDYQEVGGQFGEAADRINDMMFSWILRRYHLDRQADLYEKDRSTFEIQREIGRRVLMIGNTEDSKRVEQMMDQFMEKEYGTEVLKKLKLRTAEIRKLLTRNN